ncbi:NAD(P)/FAD-dependent oxidoreductase [Streptomyces radiopugnans]|nr:NAD(P)/FAD-dependent oxidoreductase [Streptomyces radiopugnans]
MALPPADGLGIELRTGAAATALRLADRTLALADGSRLDWDALVVATGAAARPWPAPVPGGVHTLRTLDDARALRRELAAEGARLLVVGAGFLGSEAAATAAELGVPVTLVEAEELPMARGIGKVAGGFVARLHREAGVDLRTGTTVRSFTGAKPRHRRPPGRRHPRPGHRRPAGPGRRAQHGLAARQRSAPGRSRRLRRVRPRPRRGRHGGARRPRRRRRVPPSAPPGRGHAPPGALERRGGARRRRRPRPGAPGRGRRVARTPRRGALVLVRPVRGPLPLAGPPPPGRRGADRRVRRARPKRLEVTYHRDGELVGVLTANRTRRLAAYRPRLADAFRHRRAAAAAL